MRIRSPNHRIFNWGRGLGQEGMGSSKEAVRRMKVAEIIIIR